MNRVKNQGPARRLPLRKRRRRQRSISRISNAWQGAQNGQENYRLLFEKNPMPAWVFDRETLAFLAVNDAAVRRYGLSRAEMLGLTIKDVYAPEDVQRLVAPGTGESKTAAWTAHRKDGTNVSVEVDWGDVDFAGRPVRLVVVRDAALRNQALKAYQEAGQRKDDFLAVLAHELRNPLAPNSQRPSGLKATGRRQSDGAAFCRK